MPRETEREAYERLHAKYGQSRSRGRSRREPEPEPDDDDGPGTEGVFVLAGRHGDEFLNRMFGPGGARLVEDDPDDEDDDDEDQDDEDPPPARQSNRFFGSRGARG